MAGKGRDDLVFIGAQGRRPSRVALATARVQPCPRFAEADFPKVTPHDLRHTAACLAVSAGGNVLALARMLGPRGPKPDAEDLRGLVRHGPRCPWLTCFDQAPLGMHSTAGTCH